MHILEMYTLLAVSYPNDLGHGIRLNGNLLEVFSVKVLIDCVRR